ncbi:unnamed protein product [Ectocarpus sp. CCAP 1310/34]|nr:unnamed protein product [Ectocarpus sp. CCAP 1310/34]
MRGLWLATTASCCLSSSPSEGGMAPLPTAAAASLITRGGLGFTASRARLLVGGNRKGGQSLAAAASTAAATATPGFVLPFSTTSTWISRAQRQRGHVTAAVQRRRPRVAAYPSRSVVTAPACLTGAARRPSQRFFYSSLERATTAAPAVVGLAATRVEGDLEAVATEGEEEEKEEGPAPFKVGARARHCRLENRTRQRMCMPAPPLQKQMRDSLMYHALAVRRIGELRVFPYSHARSPKLLPAATQRHVYMLTKVNLLEMSNAEVEAFLVAMGEPKFRAKQVLKWIFEGGAESFEDMANIPKTLRAKLAKVATVGALEVSKDGTKKLAYRLSDGQIIESVLMPYSDGRRTACISSQAGCAMGCVFCATGQMGFKRQLSAAEIFEQAYRFSQELQKRGDRLSNVIHRTVDVANAALSSPSTKVFMGMGEPLANYKNVMEAVRRINTELGIGARHITISTVGLVPRILRLSQENIQVKLAVSLHAANDRERGALLPVNRRFPLSELMDACREYVDVSGRRMTFEWALIQGENDSAEVASELGRLLRPLKGMCHVNIIPLNPTDGYKGGPSMADAVNQFVEVLAKNGVPATPRQASVLSSSIWPSQDFFRFLLL